MLVKSMYSKSVIALIFLLHTALPLAATNEQVGVGAGHTAPVFSLSDLRGKSHSLEQLRKKGYVLLLFWSTRCHYCYAMIPQFKNIHEQYRKKGLTLVAVNIGYENRTEVKEFVSDNKLPYLVLNDDEQKENVIEKYSLAATPTIVLVAPDGQIKYKGHRLPDLSRYISSAK